MVEEIKPVKAQYAHGDTVTITIYKDSDESVIVENAETSEIGSTGIFLYQPVFTVPTSLTTYTCVFTNGTYSQITEIELGTYDYQSSQLDIPTVEEIDEQMTDTHGEGQWTNSLGSGIVAWSYELTDEESGLPISNANVWLTTDEDGLNIIASGVTNSLGIVTFYPDLDAGTTIYVWRQKVGYNPENPDVEVI